jgi:hypothetical protein
MYELIHTLRACLLFALTLTGCSSIGNQQFYALEPTRELTVHNQEIYRVLTPSEYAGVEFDLTEAYSFWPIEEMLGTLYQALDDGVVPVVLSNHAQSIIAEMRARPPEDGADTDVLTLLEARKLLAAITAPQGEEPLARPLLRRVSSANELIPGDLALVQVEIGERGNTNGGSDAQLFEFRLDSNGTVTTEWTSYLARRSHTLGVTTSQASTSWFADWGCKDGSHELIELTITEKLSSDEGLQAAGNKGDGEALSPDAPDSEFDYGATPEISGSLIPRDAALPYRLISPGVDTSNGERIEPGFPLTIIANRLFLAEDGDPLLYLTGEVAVVATVTEGGAEPRSFLAAYHEKVDAMSFVPFWGAILYSTVSWSGEPITIKIQVLELDGQDNAYFSAILSAAAESAGTLTPALQPDFGIARTLGDTLIANNQDDEILRFELTFVHDSSDESIGALVPRNRSYVVLRPQSGNFINPAEVDFTDQWQLLPRNRDHWRDAWTDTSGKRVEHYDFFREWVPFVNRSPPPPSYLSLTASESIVIPEAVMQSREADLKERIANFSPDSSSQDHLETLKESLNRLASAPLYVSILRQVLQLPIETPISPATWNEIASIATRLAAMYPKSDSNGNPLPMELTARLTPPDLDALRVVLRGRFPTLSLDGSWAEIALLAAQSATAGATQAIELALGRIALADEVSSKVWEDLLSVARQVERDSTLNDTTRLELYERIANFSLVAGKLDEFLRKDGGDLSWTVLVNALERGLRDQRKAEKEQREDDRKAQNKGNAKVNTNGAQSNGDGAPVEAEAGPGEADGN